MICEDGRERGRKTERNIEMPYAEIKAMINHSAKWLRRNNQQRYRVGDNSCCSSTRNYVEPEMVGQNPSKSH